MSDTNIYAVNYRPYRVAEMQVQTFRCGKVATTVVLRELNGDSEVTVCTTKDWKQVIGATFLRST